jgi:DNA helicase-2/ATP-dependent DNA helicase PcrA
MGELSSANQSVIDEELSIHERVKDAVREAALKASPNMDGVKENLIELRDEAIHASERDLPSLFQQMTIQHSLAARDFAKKLPDMRAPYFGRMVLREGDKTRQILIGNQTFIDVDAGVTIVDWRHAEIAKVFFNYREGDDYEIELPGRFAEGEIHLRRILAFDVGELVGITGNELSLFRERGGQWSAGSGGTAGFAYDDDSRADRLKFGTGLTNQKHAEISALLDKQQYEIMNRHDKKPLLVLGGAGCGKTTIALHRMAQLAYKRPDFYTQNSMMVVVPEQGLVRLSERLLNNLDLRKVPVFTFDSWARQQSKKLLRGVPKLFCQYTPSSVIYIKRHPAMLKMIKSYVDLQTQRISQSMRNSIAGVDQLADEFLNSSLPLHQRMSSWQTKCVESGALPLQVESFFKRELAELTNAEVIRSEIYSNQELLNVLVESSEGAITPSMIKTLRDHTRAQYSEDPSRGTGGMKTVDGAEMDRDEFAGTMDVEDIPVLFCAIKEIVGRVEVNRKGITRYSHMVVDEAQDLGPLELIVLGAGLGSKSSITVAGDAAQQSDPSVIFEGWDNLFGRMGIPGVEATMLQTNYRCPKPIAEYGHRILGRLAPQALPNTIRDGKPVLRDVFPNEGVANAALSDALSQLLEIEKLASIAIICADEESARNLYKGLEHNIRGVRYVPDGEFSFKPGIDVTDVAQVKGLEFDYVIIPDANARQYPESDVARRALHVAVTRAVHQLWVMSIGRPTDLLQ